MSKLGAVLTGVFGAMLLIMGFVALGLTQSPRPKSFPPEVYVRMTQMEWVLAIIFLPIGMWMLRSAIVRLRDPADETPNEESHSETS